MCTRGIGVQQLLLMHKVCRATVLLLFAGRLVLGDLLDSAAQGKVQLSPASLHAAYTYLQISKQPDQSHVLADFITEGALRTLLADAAARDAQQRKSKPVAAQSVPALAPLSSATGALSANVAAAAAAAKSKRADRRRWRACGHRRVSEAAVSGRRHRADGAHARRERGPWSGQCDGAACAGRCAAGCRAGRVPRFEAAGGDSAGLSKCERGRARRRGCHAGRQHRRVIYYLFNC